MSPSLLEGLKRSSYTQISKSFEDYIKTLPKGWDALRESKMVSASTFKELLERSSANEKERRPEFLSSEITMKRLRDTLDSQLILDLRDSESNVHLVGDFDNYAAYFVANNLSKLSEATAKKIAQRRLPCLASAALSSEVSVSTKVLLAKEAHLYARFAWLASPEAATVSETDRERLVFETPDAVFERFEGTNFHDRLVSNQIVTLAMLLLKYPHLRSRAALNDNVLFRTSASLVPMAEEDQVKFLEISIAERKGYNHSNSLREISRIGDLYLIPVLHLLAAPWASAEAVHYATSLSIEYCTFRGGLETLFFSGNFSYRNETAVRSEGENALHMSPFLKHFVEIWRGNKPKFDKESRNSQRFALTLCTKQKDFNKKLVELGRFHPFRADKYRNQYPDFENYATLNLSVDQYAKVDDLFKASIFVPANKVLKTLEEIF